MAKTDWQTGDNVTATLLNALGSEVTSLHQRPLSASYQPLQGTTAAISHTLASGLDVSGLTDISWEDSAGKWRWVGMTPTALGIDANWCVNDNNAFANASSKFQPIVIEFWSNAEAVRPYVFSGGGAEDYWVTVDDRRVIDTYWHLTAAANSYTIKLSQTGAVWRKWRISVGPAFGGLAITSGAGIVPTTPGFQLAVLGDSWVSGGVSIANAVSPGNAGVIMSGNPFGEMQQFSGIDVWLCGVGDTGYVAQGGLGATAIYGSTTRVNKLDGLGAMDAVLVVGSANDYTADESTLTSAANSAWTAIKATNPNSPLIVAGVECIQMSNTDLDDTNDWLIAAAQAHTDVDTVIDLRAATFITGTGYDGSAQGDGNADAFMATDNLHFTHWGNRWAGQNLARMLGEVMIPQ